MGLLEKYLERAAPDWMPYVYLIAFLGLVLFAFLRAYVVSRDMLNTNKSLGERMKAAEDRIGVLEGDRERMDERSEAIERRADDTNKLLNTILTEVMRIPHVVAASINAAAGDR